ncbi:hypothetical protein QUB53_28605 [Microcoleus sp. AT8-B4]|uniref:hypothetical protein n=1 Tax=Microcoleus sp. AT8-B4 TaxID=2818620 RepID=UPI002FD5826F
MRSQLATEESRYEELGDEYEALDEKYKELDEKYDETVEWWKEEEAKVAARDVVIAQLRSESDLKQKSAAAGEFPDAADLYNQFKAENPKTKFTYKDFVAIVAMARVMMKES